MLKEILINFIGFFFTATIIILMIYAQTLNSRIIHFFKENQPELFNTIYKTEYTKLLGTFLGLTWHLQTRYWHNNFPDEIQKHKKNLRNTIKGIFGTIATLIILILIYTRPT